MPGVAFKISRMTMLSLIRLNKLGKITVRLPYFLFAQKKGTELNDFTRWTEMVDIDQHSNNGINEVDYHVAGGGENLVADAGDFENFLFPRLTYPPPWKTT